MIDIDYKQSYNLKDNEVAVPFWIPPSGRKLWYSKAPYIIFHGPAGTGKTRVILEWIHYLLNMYPGARALMARQFRNSMTHTCMKTYTKEVIQEAEKIRWKPTDQTFMYPMRKAERGMFRGKSAQSEIVVSGLDDMRKIMSSQFDIIFVNEGTDISREDFEYLVTRNRNGVLPWQVLILDCNPRGPKHWVKQMMDLGWIGDPDNKIMVIEGKFTDNPRWWDRTLQDWTPQGLDFYFKKLGALSGARRARLRDGKWVSEEGQIYADFDRGVHVVANFTPPTSWRRLWVFDFGFVNPFVWHNYAIDPDGFMHLHQEIYHSHLPVAKAAAMIKTAVLGQPWPEALICDHDAGDRNILEQELGLPTMPAFKEVSTGIQAVQKRLNLVYDGKNRRPNENDEMVDRGRPRLVLMNDTLIHEPDPLLKEASKPTMTLDEFEGYVWDKKAEERQTGDKPVKQDDHGVDVTRYAVAYEDSIAIIPSEEEQTIPLGLQYQVRISSL